MNQKYVRLLDQNLTLKCMWEIEDDKKVDYHEQHLLIKN